MIRFRNVYGSAAYGHVSVLRWISEVRPRFGSVVCFGWALDFVMHITCGFDSDSDGRNFFQVRGPERFRHQQVHMIIKESVRADW
jgi:hypothetical protein